MFVATDTQGRWQDKEAFKRAVESANVNYETEALVLIRNTEGSGGNAVSLDAPRFRGKQLVFRLRRNVAAGGTADVVEYGYAVAVSGARINEVVVEVDKKSLIRLPIERQ